MLPEGQDADLNLNLDEWPPNAGVLLTAYDRENQHALWTLLAPGMSSHLHCCLVIDIFHWQIRKEIARRDCASPRSKQP